MQDVFVTLIQKLPQFTYDPNKSFRAWLRTVAENRWRDALRKQCRRNADDAGLADAPYPDETSTPYGRRNTGNMLFGVRSRSCAGFRGKDLEGVLGSGCRGQVRGGSRRRFGHDA